MLEIITSLAPRIRKEDFDKEAKAFLLKYCPEALQTPMAVPILEIARKKMGLQVIECHLSEDFSILAQMCFSNGLAEIYDKENDEYREVKVRFGSILIDPDTVKKRNEGCFNNTMAHECFHWHKHRDYHIAVSVRDSIKAVTRNRYYDDKPESPQKDCSDEKWMEWQANGIAPRILMPLDTFKVMVEKYMDEYKSYHDAGTGNYSMYGWVINRLSDFFKVSKQSAEIRLNETGLFDGD